MFRERGIDGDKQREDGQDQKCDLDQVRDRIRDERPIKDVGLRRRQDNSEDRACAAEGCECDGNRESEMRGEFSQSQEIDGHYDQRRGYDDHFRHCELQ